MKLKSCFIFIQFLFFCSYVSLVSSIAPIENIRDAKANEFPFVASIGNKNFRGNGVNHFCTGALISKKFILTADHCFKDDDDTIIEKAEELQVKVNAVSLKQTSTKYNVKGWILYDEWAAKNNKKVNHNDMAIILLTEEVAGVQSGQLSDAQRLSLNNKPAIIIGYGGTTQTGLSDKLQIGNVKVLEHKECIEKYRKSTGTRLIPAKDHFCTQGSPYAILQDGDSGGPILDSGKKIIGVSSYRSPGTSEAVNMHLTIEDHRDFINDVTNNPQKYFK